MDADDCRRKKKMQTTQWMRTIAKERKMQTIWWVQRGAKKEEKEENADGYETEKEENADFVVGANGCKRERKKNKNKMQTALACRRIPNKEENADIVVGANGWKKKKKKKKRRRKRRRRKEEEEKEENADHAVDTKRKKLYWGVHNYHRPMQRTPANLGTIQGSLK